MLARGRDLICSFFKGPKTKVTNLMWDTKRQVIWLIGGISFGTLIVYLDARDDFGRFDPTVFIFWEIILLIIIVVLFWLYSRRK